MIALKRALSAVFARQRRYGWDLRIARGSAGTNGDIKTGLVEEISRICGISVIDKILGPFRDLSLLTPPGLVEFGFLMSVFFAPWGPVLRYLAWVVVLAGLAWEYRRHVAFRNVLCPGVGLVLLVLLLLGLATTVLLKHDVYAVLKGYSLLLEFAFSLWLAARVFINRDPQTQDRFIAALACSVVFVFATHAVEAVIAVDFAAPFGNINTLGLYAVTVLPLVLSRALNGESLSWWACAAFVFLLLCMSFSTGAWVSGGVGVLAVFLLSKTRLRQMVFPIAAVAVIAVVLATVLLVSSQSLRDDFRQQAFREFDQISAVNSPMRFTAYRSVIWKGTWSLIKDRPIFGWGWGSFTKVLAEENECWWTAGQYRIDAGDVDDAHSMYLNLLVYGGVTTFSLVLWIFAVSAYRSFLFIKRGVPFTWFWVGILSLMVSLLVYGSVGDIFSIRSKFACIAWYLVGIPLARHAGGEE